MSNNKRNRSPHQEEEETSSKRVCTQPNLLSDLSQVLHTIQSTPSSGEISAEILETFKVLLLEIDQLPPDDDEATRLKQESELTLESWFEELLEKCEGELDLDELFASDEEQEDSVAFTMVEEVEEEEIIIIDDEGSEVGSQRLALFT
jgi:hypothetical protein